jgi:regulator of sigma E protease
MDFLDILKAAGLLIAALSILVTWHELGHYLPAKLFKMRVDKFFLFFDWPRKLWSIKKGETEYGVGLLPLGGYVKIYGMVDESMDTDNLQKAPEPYEFRAKPRWQRLVVMVGGVTMNVILAIGIYAVLAFVRGEVKTPTASLPNGIEVVAGTLADSLGFRTGDRPVAANGQPLVYLEDAGRAENLMAENGYYEVEREGQRVRVEIPAGVLNMLAEINERRGMQPLFLPNYSNQVMAPGPDTLDGETTPAYAAGLRTGDRILALDSTATPTFAHIRAYVKAHANQAVGITALRGADTLRLTARIDTAGRLGILFLQNSISLDTTHYGFFASVAKGWESAWGTLWGNIIGLGKVFRGEVDASKSVSGPIGIAKLYAKMDFWSLTAMLSMVLAFMNILPIPALDGGHVLILLIEGAIRRDLPLRVKMVIQQVGFFLMLGLMALIFFNDIVKLFN